VSSGQYIRCSTTVLLSSGEVECWATSMCCDLKAARVALVTATVTDLLLLAAVHPCRATSHHCSDSLVRFTFTIPLSRYGCRPSPLPSTANASSCRRITHAPSPYSQRLPGYARTLGPPTCPPTRPSRSHSETTYPPSDYARPMDESGDENKATHSHQHSALNCHHAVYRCQVQPHTAPTCAASLLLPGKWQSAGSRQQATGNRYTESATAGHSHTGEG